MDSIFKISKKDSCGITITGLELDNDEYLNSDSLLVSTRAYTYKQSVTLNVLEHLNSKQEKSLEYYKVVLHNVDCIDECDMITKQDGLYSVYHIILPNNTWLEYVLNTSPDSLDVYTLIYYYDENTSCFMKYYNGNSELVEIEEILTVNPMANYKYNEKTTTIIKGIKNTFLMCYLMDCYYGIAYKLLSQLPQRCPENFKDPQLTFYRDLLWMTINVIKYMLEKGLYLEASRILENVNKCHQICGNEYLDIKEVYCGCS